MHMKTHSYRNSLGILVCSFVACWLVGAASVRAGDLIQLKPPKERTWVTGYVTNAAEREKVWTNRVSQAAESGDAAAQVSLAICLHDGMHGFSTNRVQAYKWAALAAVHGDYKAKHLVEEWQASMSPKDVAAGKAAAAAFTPRDKTKQD
jgi:hypothetical protein